MCAAGHEAGELYQAALNLCQSNSLDSSSWHHTLQAQPQADASYLLRLTISTVQPWLGDLSTKHMQAAEEVVSREVSRQLTDLQLRSYICCTLRLPLTPLCRSPWRGVCLCQMPCRICTPG